MKGRKTREFIVLDNEPLRYFVPNIRLRTAKESRSISFATEVTSYHDQGKRILKTRIVQEFSLQLFKPNRTMYAVCGFRIKEPYSVMGLTRGGYSKTCLLSYLEKMLLSIL